MTHLMKFVVVAGLLWPGGAACVQTLDAVRSSQRLACGTRDRRPPPRGRNRDGDAAGAVARELPCARGRLPLPSRSICVAPDRACAP
jgi:hypothetical protein